MQTKDHFLLGRFLWIQQGTRAAPLCRALFLWGCVEPDWNPVTYLRGSIKHRFLRGHNADNVQRHLHRTVRSLQASGVRTPLQWFRLGAALHYAADSFTWAHSSAFGGDLKEHRRYEEQLHAVWENTLMGPLPCFPEADFSYETWQTQYRADVHSCETDCRYILGAVRALYRQLDFADGHGTADAWQLRAKGGAHFL